MTHRQRLPQLTDAMKFFTCPGIQTQGAYSPHYYRARGVAIYFNRPVKVTRRVLPRAVPKSPRKLRVIPSTAFGSRKIRSRSEGRMETSVVHINPPRPVLLNYVYSPVARKRLDFSRTKPTFTAKVSPVRRPVSPQESDRSSVGPW